LLNTPPHCFHFEHALFTSPEQLHAIRLVCEMFRGSSQRLPDIFPRIHLGCLEDLPGIFVGCPLPTIHKYLCMYNTRMYMQHCVPCKETHLCLAEPFCACRVVHETWTLCYEHLCEAVSAVVRIMRTTQQHGKTVYKEKGATLDKDMSRCVSTCVWVRKLLLERAYVHIYIYVYMYTPTCIHTYTHRVRGVHVCF